MGNRITSVRVKRPDGTYSNEIPISPSADKVIWKDNEHNLEEILGNVDTTKPIQNQINQKVNTAELQEYIDTELAGDVDDWLDEHITIPDTAITLDDTLSTATSAAPAKTVGDIVHESIAPKFSSLLNYKIGDCVFYENHFYKFIIDHAAGTWDATHVEVADDLAKQISTKAEQDGYYSDMTVGDAEQLVATEFIEDDELYTFRKAGGNYDIGNRQYDQLEGGSIVWNQLFNPANVSETISDVTITKQTNNSYKISGTASADVTRGLNASAISIAVSHVYCLLGIKNGSSDTYAFRFNMTNELFGSETIYKKASGNNFDTNLQIKIKSGTNVDITVIPQFFDLTVMFGTEIADYIYSLEQANEGDGVAWFKKYFPKDYYAYDPGSLQSVNVASHNTVGFNQWDEEWEVGAINGSSGTNTDNSSKIRSKNYLKIIPNETYYCHYSGTNSLIGFYYDKNKTYLGNGTQVNIPPDTTFIIPPNVYYMRFSIAQTTYTDSNRICINISDPSRNGEYEPYNKHSYPYDSSLQLRGIPKLVDGKLTYDGDIYQSNGTVTRKYGIVDLGTLTWSYTDNNVFYNSTISNKKRSHLTIVCDKYTSPYTTNTSLVSMTDKTIQNRTDTDAIYIKDSSYTDAATFKTAMSGVYLVYELATPTTETAAPFVYSQEVDNYGTEEYVDAGVLATTRDVSVPVGHHTKYPPNLRDKLQHLPFLAEEDGDYYIQQSNKKMALKKMEGDFENIVAGSAKQLLSDSYVEDTDIYQFRKSANGMAIGERQLVKEITGGSIVWNQLVENGNFADSSYWSPQNSNFSISNGVATFTASQQNGGIYSNAGHKILGHRYLAFVDLKGTSAFSDSVLYSWGQESSRTLNITTAWQTFYQFITCVATSTGNMMMLRDHRASGWDAIQVRNAMVIDLTAMFGTEIADYIYSLEQANQGDGVAFFRKFFSNDYYVYNAGELMSVGGLSEHKNVGFNQWDEEWELGSINEITGEPAADNSKIRSKNFTRLVPNTTYYIYRGGNVGAGVVLFYDCNKNYIGKVYKQNDTFTTPTDCHFLKIKLENYGTTYNHDICINLSDPAKNGTYEPYKSNSYPFDSSVELRGIPKLDANNKLYYDGDRYLANGVVEKKYGIVDLGTLTWNYSEGYFKSSGIDAFIKRESRDTDIPNAICTKYKPIQWSTTADKSIYVLPKKYTSILSTFLWVKDSDYSDASTFKTAISGVMLVYELATPTTEQAQPYQAIQIVDGSGTEEFVTTSLLPPQCTTQYYENMREKLEKLPHTAASQGDYIITQSNGKMSLKPDVSSHKADIDGHYENLTAGTADQLNSNVFVQDSEPYVFRTAGGSASIGDRLEEEIVGGTVAWNQLYRQYNLINKTINGISITYDSSKNTLTFDGQANAAVDYNLTESELNLSQNHVYYLSSSNSKWKGEPQHGFLINGKNFNFAEGIFKCNYNNESNRWFEIRYRQNEIADNDIWVLDFNLYDLTAMFGSTIANYIYSLEQATAGAGVSFFKKFFPKDYYEYNAGELMSVSGLSEHKTVGFNVWDEKWEFGSINNQNGMNVSVGTNRIRSKGYTKVVPNTNYNLFNGTNVGVWVYFYDDSKNWISMNQSGTLINKCIQFTTPANCQYIRFRTDDNYGTTYNHDICINISDSSRNGEYEPYKSHSYPLDDSLTLRGIPKLDSNNKLYFDGDRYLANGVVERRYGIVDLGTLDWTKNDNWGSSGNIITFGSGEISDAKGTDGYNDYANAFAEKFKIASRNQLYNGEVIDGLNISSGKRIQIVPSATYTDSGAFKTAMSGVYLVYELATQTIEQATPFTSPQIVDNFGTEEYVINTEDDVIVPIGHNTKYPADLKSKLEMVPESPNGNGDYIVRQTDGTNTYVPLVIPSELPTLPTENGNYILKVTVDGSTKTLSWVAQS